jgi:hypothetical protein
LAQITCQHSLMYYSTPWLVLEHLVLEHLVLEHP